MPKRIRIGNMNVTTTETTMVNGFDDFGTIVTHSLEHDVAGQSLGIGHIEYTNSAAGTWAIATMDRTVFDGSTISVMEDT